MASLSSMILGLLLLICFGLHVESVCAEKQDTKPVVTSNPVKKTAVVQPQVANHNVSTKVKMLPTSADVKHLNKKVETPEEAQAETTSFGKTGRETAPYKFASPQSILYPILQYEIPKAEHINLDNGMTLFLLEDHELPLVRMSVVIRTGSAYDPPDQAGLAELSCRTMRTAGTALLIGDELDNRLDRLAINIWGNADLEAAQFSLNTLKENLEPAVDLFSQILNTPRFDPDKVRIEKELILEGMRRIEDDPQEYAFREFRKQLYRGNPRGNQKTMASVGKLQVSDLVNFHQKYFYPENMMISVTGDINREEAVQLLSKYFLPSPRNQEIGALPAPLIRSDGRVLVVPKDTPQSIVLMGFAAPSKNTQDYYAFSILDFVLGSGGFRSRIFQEIRNNQGLAYSAGSFYKAKGDYGVLSTYGMTKTESTMKVLEAMKSIVAEVGKAPLKPEEISWATKSITNNFLFSFVSAEQIAYQQMMIEYEGLPEDFLQKYRQRIQKVKSGDIQSLAGKYLRSEQATVLILGDEKRFDQPVKASSILKPSN